MLTKKFSNDKLCYLISKFMNKTQLILLEACFIGMNGLLNL